MLDWLTTAANKHIVNQQMEATLSKAVRGGRCGGDILGYAKEFEVESIPAPGFPHYIVASFAAVTELRVRSISKLAGDSDPDSEIRTRYRIAWEQLIRFGENAARFARTSPEMAKLELIELSPEIIEAETRLSKGDLMAWLENAMSMAEAEDILAAIG